jgi:hypothetical protein
VQECFLLSCIPVEGDCSCIPLSKKGKEKITNQALKRGQTRLGEWSMELKLGTPELSVRTAKASAHHNCIKAKKRLKFHRRGVKKKLTWGSEEKKRGETKTNMASMQLSSFSRHL